MIEDWFYSLASTCFVYLTESLKHDVRLGIFVGSITLWKLYLLKELFTIDFLDLDATCDFQKHLRLSEFDFFS